MIMNLLSINSVLGFPISIPDAIKNIFATTPPVNICSTPFSKN